MKVLRINCPCKINLGLDITGRREDGYHLMRMVMQSISLADTLVLTANNSGAIVVDCVAKGVPQDERNIAHRAGVAFFGALGGMPNGVTLRLIKRIPCQAGLGGGSADAAGTLFGLNLLFGSPFTTRELCRIGGQVGADVPFCLVGGTALAQGIGEELTPLPPMPRCHILLAKPREGVSTPSCFAAYDRMELRPRWEEEPLFQGLAHGDLGEMAQGLFNVLEGPAGLPEIFRLKELLVHSGAVGALMSGSGSVVFGLFVDEGEALIAAQKLMERGYWHALTRPISCGPRVI